MNLPRKQLALIHVAKRETGLSDDEYRVFLQGAAGIDSAKDIRNQGQFEAVMAAFEELSFTPCKGRVDDKWSRTAQDKITAFLKSNEDPATILYNDTPSKCATCPFWQGKEGCGNRYTCYREEM